MISITFKIPCKIDTFLLHKHIFLQYNYNDYCVSVTCFTVTEPKRQSKREEIMFTLSGGQILSFNQQ